MLYGNAADPVRGHGGIFNDEGQYGPFGLCCQHDAHGEFRVFGRRHTCPAHLSSLYFTTIASNRAAALAGGIEVSTGNVTLINSIVANNIAATHNDFAGDRVVAEYSLIGDADPATLWEGSHDFLTNVDPRLGPLQDNGGPTWTMELLDGSPALNSGTPVPTPPILTNLPVTTTDQRGVPRGVQVNMGAYQASPASLAVSGPDSVIVGTPFTVTITASHRHLWQDGARLQRPRVRQSRRGRFRCSGPRRAHEWGRLGSSNPHGPGYTDAGHHGPCPGVDDHLDRDE